MLPPMTRKVLVVGAYGLIGSYVVARLLRDGDEVIGVGRDVVAAQRRVPGVRWVKADLATTSVETWAALLAGAHAVVNCAGALQDSPRDDLGAVHETGVARLMQACATAGVARFVHLSAASVEPGRATAFNATKWAAEAAFEASPLDWVILRPGLVLAPAAYGGTALLRGLAATPFVLPVVYPDSLIQTVSIDDVSEAVVRALAADAPVRVKVDLVHADAVRLAELVKTLRAWLGLKPAPVLPLPAFLARMTAIPSDALAWLGWRSPMRTAALEQLRMGVRGDATSAQRVLGLTLRSLGETLAAWPSGVQERWFARIYFLKPIILITLALFWLASGLIGLSVGRPAAEAVLTVVGVPALAAKAMVIGGGIVDVALGVAVSFRASARLALQGTLAVSAAYLLGATVLRPELWLDPLGPLVKVIPAALLAAAALAILDER
jgi:uncharacterized protein YbjT (DUF2867 family)